MGYPPVINIDRGESPFKQVTSGLSAGLETLVDQYREKKKTQSQLAGLAPLFEEMGISSEKVEKLVESGLPPALAIQALATVSKVSDPFKTGREKRLKEKDFTDRYSRAIAQINTDLKEAPFSKEKQALQEKKANLQREQAANLKLMREGKPPSFKYLEDEMIRGREEEFGIAAVPAAKKAKLKFDTANPTHMARRDQLLKTSGGDKAKANALLAEEFER